MYTNASFWGDIMKFNNEKLKNTSFVIDKEKKIEGRIASDIKPWLKFYDVDVEKYTDEKTAYLILI